MGQLVMSRPQTIDTSIQLLQSMRLKLNRQVQNVRIHSSKKKKMLKWVAIIHQYVRIHKNNWYEIKYKLGELRIERRVWNRRSAGGRGGRLWDGPNHLRRCLSRLVSVICIVFFVPFCFPFMTALGCTCLILGKFVENRHVFSPCTRQHRPIPEGWKLVREVEKS